MRNHCIACGAVMAAIFLLAGCGAEILTVAATQAELQKQAAQGATRHLQQAGAQSGRIQAERAIQTYHVEKGHWPPSLEALVPNYLASVPTRADGSPWGYDAATGRLTEGRAGMGGGHGEDMRNLERIRQAINQYGHATGYYPGSLQALVPHYLPEVPRTHQGQEFFYNPANGDLRVPGMAAGTGAGTGAGAGAGAGSGLSPMGEAMTGVGIQQQLGNTSNAGSSAAGGLGRRGINNAATQQNRQAQEALGYLD